MSRVGNKVIPVPDSVQLDLQDGRISVKGKNGTLEIVISHLITVEMSDEGLVVGRKADTKDAKSLHGLYRSKINNAIKGVSEFWEKRLEVVGTGYNVKLQGEDLVFKVGYSHLVTFNKPEGVSFKVEGNNKAVVIGIDKQLVGEVAYKIRAIKKPDDYKGKGIRYEGEYVVLKPGKKAKA